MGRKLIILPVYLLVGSRSKYNQRQVGTRELSVLFIQYDPA